MFPDARTLAAELAPVLPAGGQLHQDADTVLLLPARVGWPIRLVATDDVARVFTGTSSHILIGADDPTDSSVVIEVVRAIQRGNAEEYFGTSEDGHLTVIGHRVWFPSGGLRRLDAGASPVATYRAPAWGR